MRTLLAATLCLLLTALPARASERDWWVDAERQAAQDGYRLLDTAGMAEALEMDSPPLIIDVRPDYEYAQGHLPGALNMEFGPGDESRVDPDKKRRFETLVGQDKDRSVVLYCRSFW